MRKFIFFLTAGVIVLLLIVLFFVFQFISAPKKIEPPILSIPTPIPLQRQQDPVRPAPNVKYSKQKTEELLSKLQIRQPLSPEGQNTKQRLIEGLGNTSGRLFTNNNVGIDYVASPDQFQAEILSSDINSAKQDAVSFMLSQGFSPSDICYLPLNFYLNFQVSEELKNSGIIFNPLPEGC